MPELNKIKEFFKKPSNLILIGILILTLVIRLYYFNTNQAVWWDEAEYLLEAKHLAFGTPNTGFGEVRPILLSFILSLFYRLGGTETTSRIIILLFSILGVYLTYLVGKEFFNKNVGLIAAFLLSIFYLDIFNTLRILVDIPGTTIILLIIYLFWKGYYSNKKYIYLFGIAFAIGFMMRFTSVLYLLAILLYLLITEQLRFLKVKELWIAGILSFLVALPYFIWSQLTYGNPLKSLLRSGGDGLKYSAEKGFQEAFGRFLGYITQSPFYLKTALFILFIIGLISFYKLIIGFDLVVRRKEKSLNPYLFLLLWILIPLLYFSFLFHVFDQRYLLSIFPAIFIIAGLGAMFVYDFIKEYDKKLALIAILFILLFAGYQQSVFAKDTIESRANSFVQFRYSGEWMKSRTNPSDIIFNTGVPQNTYYTERETFGHGSEENFNKILKEGRIKYFVVSRLEIPPEWVFSYPQRNPDKLRIVYACDNSVCTDDLAKINRNSITLVVYEFIAF